MVPDDTAGPPLTPGEQAAIADLEQRLLLDEPGPRHPGLARLGRRRRSGAAASTAAVPLAALLATACALVALLIVVGGGLLGTAAVLASVAGTALLWPLLPARLGGPVRPPRRSRVRRQLRGRP